MERLAQPRRRRRARRHQRGRHRLGREAPRRAWEDVATALHVSTCSLVALGRGFAPLLASAGRGSVVGLDFDASVAWPDDDWMGVAVAKAGLESVARYLARELVRRARA